MKKTLENIKRRSRGEFTEEELYQVGEKTFFSKKIQDKKTDRRARKDVDFLFLQRESKKTQFRADFLYR